MKMKIELLRGNYNEDMLKVVFDKVRESEICLVAEVAGEEIFRTTIRKNAIVHNEYVCNFCSVNKNMKYIWFYYVSQGRKVYIDRVSIYNFKKIGLNDHLQWYFKQASDDFMYRYGG